MRPILLLLLGLFCLFGCSLMSSNPKELKSKELDIRFSERDWKLIPAENSDQAWLSNSGEVLVANSLCKKYENNSLQNLSQNIISGLKNVEILEQKEIVFFDREAKDMKLKGTVDGVDVFLKLRTFKRNHCTFDFALISPKSLSPKGEEAFEHLLQSVRFK